jgi:enoyl-CoA hydratase
MPELLISDPKPFVRQLTINRPDVRNALSNAVLDQIATALEAARDDDAVRAVVLTGGENSSRPAPICANWRSAIR